MISGFTHVGDYSPHFLGVSSANLRNLVDEKRTPPGDPGLHSPREVKTRPHKRTRKQIIVS